MSEDSEMGLLYAFPDGSASFVHGFEAGQIVALMQSKEAEIDRGYEEGIPIHTANVELLGRMCAHYGYALESKPTDYTEWTTARMTRQAKTRPALKVVCND